MILFNLKDKNFSSVKEKPFEREKEIQTIVESNTEEIFNLRFVMFCFRWNWKNLYHELVIF